MDALAVVAILGLTALVAKGTADMRAANADKRRVLGGYTGRDVAIVMDSGGRVSIELRIAGRLETVDGKGATIREPDGTVRFVPLAAVRALEHEQQRVAAW